jgi:hypothetical protein
MYQFNKRKNVAERLKAAGITNVWLFMDQENSHLPQFGHKYMTPNQAIAFGGEAEKALWALVKEMEAKAHA